MGWSVNRLKGSPASAPKLSVITTAKRTETSSVKISNQNYCHISVMFLIPFQLFVIWCYVTSLLLMRKKMPYWRTLIMLRRISYAMYWYTDFPEILLKWVIKIPAHPLPEWMMLCTYPCFLNQRNILQDVLMPSLNSISCCTYPVPAFLPCGRFVL